MVDFAPHFGKTCARHSDWKYIDLSAMKVLILIFLVNVQKMQYKSYEMCLREKK